MADKRKILVIDDDEDYLASARALLEGEGYEVSQATSGHEGLGAARTGKPDLIVLDIMMESPVEGYTVVQALKFRDEYSDVAPIPVVMVSSIQEDPGSLFPMAGDLPMITPDAYFTKPLDVPKFLECVRQMLSE